MSENMRPQYGNCGAVASALIGKLKDGKPGDVITDETLAEIAGKDVSPKGAGYPSLQSAINYVLNNHHVRWKRIPKGGAIKCLNASEIVTVCKADVGAIGRKARKSAKTLNTIDVASLPDDQRSAAFATVAQLGTLASFASTEASKRLEARSVQTVPSLKGLMEAFK